VLISVQCLLLCGSAAVCLSVIPVAMQRADIRAKYNLQGNCVSDLLLACCCGLCNLVQQDKEVADREKGGAVEEQYQATGGMTYPVKQ
jgi:Cys-rich protein (TIGR01571 family)